VPCCKTQRLWLAFNDQHTVTMSPLRATGSRGQIALSYRHTAEDWWINCFIAVHMMN
jgi:hypothetical protein